MIMIDDDGIIHQVYSFDVLDEILEKMKIVREEIDRYGYDDDSIRVYDAIKEIIEMIRSKVNEV